MSNLATARAVPAHEYRPGEAGYLVECEHWRMGHDAPHYAIPAWEEMGCAELAETFPTEQAALAAINEARAVWA